MKFTTAFFLVFFVTDFALIAQESLYGKWITDQSGYSMELILNSDHSCIIDKISCTYQFSDKSLTLVIAGITTEYQYSVTKDRLVLSGGDIEGSMTFARKTGTLPPVQNKRAPLPPLAIGEADVNEALVGIWEGYNERMEFTSKGLCVIQGQTLNYTATKDNIRVGSGQQQSDMKYTLTGNVLTLTMNGQSFIYTRVKEVTGTGDTPRGNSSKSVAQELVGKWCFTNVTSTNSGGSSAERCLTLNADGTYEFYGERSMNVTTNAMYGGTSSQSRDFGTWSFDGKRIYYQSGNGFGSGSYMLEKRNHPKTKDPMIVIDGETYVTFYQKSSW